MEMRYEDLLAEPVRTLGALAGFFGNDDPSGSLIAFVDRHVHDDVRSDNAEKWRIALSQREIERFERIAGAELSRFGYARAGSGVVTPVRPLERAYWRVHGKMKRLAMRDYWADNWYKLRLRLGPFGLLRPRSSS